MTARINALSRKIESSVNPAIKYPLYRIFMFGGQGCHYYQMASHLFQTNSVFHDAMCRLDRVCQDLLCHSVVEEIFRKDKSRSDDFNRIKFTHPGIVMVQLALVSALAAEAITPDAVVGTSLGEFIACCVAGAISDTDLLAAICEQALLIEQFAEQGRLLKGGMLSAFITQDEKNVLLAEFPAVTIAGMHYARHITFSGETWAIDALEKRCQERDFLYQRIAVDYAFHSPAIHPLKEASLQSINKYPVGDFDIPFYSCARAERCRSIDVEHFWNVVESPIHFADTLDKIEATATGLTPLYIDLSPSGTLHGFVKQHIGVSRPNQLPISLALMSVMSNDVTQYQTGVFTLKRLEKAYSESVITPSGSQDNLVNYSMEYNKQRKIVNNSAINKAVVFPGQASQRVGMGRELFDRFPRYVDVANDVLGYSIKKLCLEDPHNQLNKTQYTQPALYVVCALQYLAYREDNEDQMGYLAGHSLGEYAALFAANVFDFETGLVIVKKRGELMSSASAGSMAVILNYKTQALKALLNDNGLIDIDIANINSPEQLVIAGPIQSLQKFEGIISELSGTYIPIPVGAPFHSRYMKPIANEFEGFLESFTFRQMNKTVISNVTGLPHQDESLKRLLVQQLYSPVQWVDSIRYLMGAGIEEYVELGPGDVLTKLTAKIRSQCTPLVVESESIHQFQDNGERVGKTYWHRGDEFSRQFELASPHVLILSEGNIDYSFIERSLESEHLIFQELPCTGDAIESGKLDHILHTLGDRKLNGKGGAVGVAMIHGENDEALFSRILSHPAELVTATGFYGVTKELVFFRVMSAYQEGLGLSAQKKNLFISVDDPRCVHEFYRVLPLDILELLFQQKRIDAKQLEFSKNITVCDAIVISGEEKVLDTVSELNQLKERRPQFDIKIGVEGALSAPDDLIQVLLSQLDFFVTRELNMLIGDSYLSELVRKTIFSDSEASIVELPDPQKADFGGTPRKYITYDPAAYLSMREGRAQQSVDNGSVLCQLLPSNYLAIAEWLRVQFNNERPSLSEFSSSLLKNISLVKT